MPSRIEMKRVTKNSVTLDRSIFKAERNPLAKVKGIRGL